MTGDASSSAGRGRPRSSWSPPVAACYANNLRAPFVFGRSAAGRAPRLPSRPLVWASIALNRSISGADTWSYHAFNALVHLGCGLPLLGILRRDARARRGEPRTSDAEGLALAITLALGLPSAADRVGHVPDPARRVDGRVLLARCLYAFIRSIGLAARPLPWQVLSGSSPWLAGFGTKETIVVAPLLVWMYDATFVEGGARARVAGTQGLLPGARGRRGGRVPRVRRPAALRRAVDRRVRPQEHGPIAYALSQPG